MKPEEVREQKKNEIVNKFIENLPKEFQEPIKSALNAAFDMGWVSCAKNVMANM